MATNRTGINGPLGVGFQPFGGSEQSDFDARVHTLSARFDVRAGRVNFITGGYEFENENFRNRSFQVNPADNSTVDVTQRSHALFVQDQLRLSEDRLQISLAFRTQFFSLQQPKFTPAASAPYSGIVFQSPPTAYTGDGSIAYMVRSSGTKLRAHVGNGYRAPSLFERFGTFFGSFGYSVFGDPRLRPDRSIAVDAGIDQTHSIKNRLRASATYFYTRLQEVIIFDFSGAIIRLQIRSAASVVTATRMAVSLAGRVEYDCDTYAHAECLGRLYLYQEPAAHAASSGRPPFAGDSRSSILVGCYTSALVAASWLILILQHRAITWRRSLIPTRSPAVLIGSAD